MDRYKIIKKGVFESAAKFEAKLNALSREGWKAVSMASDQSQLYVLLERER